MHPLIYLCLSFVAHLFKLKDDIQIGMDTIKLDDECEKNSKGLIGVLHILNSIIGREWPKDGKNLVYLLINIAFRVGRTLS